MYVYRRYLEALAAEEEAPVSVAEASGSWRSSGFARREPDSPTVWQPTIPPHELMFLIRRCQNAVEVGSFPWTVVGVRGYALFLRSRLESGFDDLQRSITCAIGSGPDDLRCAQKPTW